MSRLTLLQNNVITCHQCPRLVAYREHMARTKVRRFTEWEYWGKPVPGFGDPKARLLVVGLAPAAHGGNRTGRIFTGDRSGDWLYGTLHRFGFASQPHSVSRHDGMRLLDCYITATIHCAPPANKPLPEEFSHCRPFLIEELGLLTHIQVVVTLGKIALDGYLAACQAGGHHPPKPRPNFGHGMLHRLPWGVTLITSYHPSQQNTFTGKLTAKMFDSVFSRARVLLDNLPRRRRNHGESL